MLKPISQKDAETLPDEHLARLSVQDESAFYFLMRRYEPKLLRYIQRMARIDRETSEDLLQEIFIKIYRNLNGFDPDQKFSSWAYRIAYHAIVSQYRKNKRELPLMGFWDEDESGRALIDFLSDAMDVQALYLSGETAGKVEKALTELPHKYREILILRYFEGLSYREIGDVLRKPDGSIATLMNRAKAKFKKIAKRHKLDE